MDIILLYHNIKYLEDRNIQVQFWKVDPELIVGPNVMAEDHLIKFVDRAEFVKPNPCDYSYCVVESRLRERRFAEDGLLNDCCDRCKQFF